MGLRSALTGLCLLFVALAGCGDDDPGTGGLTVLAAASLTDSFSELADEFRAATGIEVTLSFAASSALASQVIDDAPADVFASADLASMERVVAEVGTLAEPEVFATNVLEIVVEPGNPRGIGGIEDLADPSILFVTAAPEVPIGRYTTQVLQAAGVEATPVSLEESVRGVLAKVTLGEADAGVVYRTDVIAAGASASGVAIPTEVNVVARYPLAMPAGAPNPDGARSFVDFVLSEEGQAVLERFGFNDP